MPYVSDRQPKTVFVCAFSDELRKLSAKRFATAEQRLSQLGRPPSKKKSLPQVPR